MERAIEILNALGNRTRLNNILTLFQEDLCVCELEEKLNMEQSRLSHQLRILRYMGLVESRQEGRRIIYSVPEKVRRNEIVRSIKKSIEYKSAEKRDP